MSEPRNVTGLRTVIDLHRRYHGTPMTAYMHQLARRRNMGWINRRSAADRTDDREMHYKLRKRTPAEIEDERLDIIAYETDARIGKHEFEQEQPYRGSRMEAEHRKRGS